MLLSLSFGVHKLFLSHAWIQLWSPPNRSYRSSYSDLEPTSVWVRFLHHAPCCGPVHCFSKARFLLHWCTWINSKTYLKVSKHIYISDYWVTSTDTCLQKSVQTLPLNLLNQNCTLSELSSCFSFDMQECMDCGWNLQLIMVPEQLVSPDSTVSPARIQAFCCHQTSLL